MMRYLLTLAVILSDHVEPNQGPKYLRISIRVTFYRCNRAVARTIKRNSNKKNQTTTCYLPNKEPTSSVLAILLYSMVHAHAQNQTPAGVAPPISGDQKKSKNEVKEAQEPKPPEMFQFAGGALMSLSNN